MWVVLETAFVFKFDMVTIQRKVDFVCSNKLQLLCIQVSEGLFTHIQISIKKDKLYYLQNIK